jgi:single-strand DNA-binding protein
MADINHVVLIGRLTRDAELKYTPQGQPVSKFAVAVNRGVKKGDKWEEEANFFDIVLWGKRGESLNQYLLKGKQVGVDGELRQERWNDRDSGQSRSKIEIIANDINLLGGGNSGNSENRGSSGGNYYSGKQSAPPKQEYTRPSSDGFTDDIPF